MDQIGQEIMARVIWLLVVLSPIMLLDFAFNKGRLTKMLFGLLGDAINGIIQLFFRLIGTGFRSLFQGIWRGIRGQHRNQQNQHLQTRRVEHHHYYHGRPGNEAGGEDDEE